MAEIIIGDSTPQENPDTNPPIAPVLSSSNITETTVDLSWSGSTDDVAIDRYEIYLDDNALANVQAESYTVINLTSGTTYNFKVRTIDTSENASKFSNIESITTSQPASDGDVVDAGTGNVTNDSGDTVVDTTPTESNPELSVAASVEVSEVPPPENGYILYYQDGLYVPSDLVLNLVNDVDASTVQNEDLLVWDETQGKWVARSMNFVIDGSIQFDSVTTPQETDILNYDGTRWVPINKEQLLSTFRFTDLSDVELVPGVDGQIITWDDTNARWHNRSIVLQDVSDIDTTNLQDGDYLSWDQTQGKWVTKTFTETSQEVANEITVEDISDVNVFNKLDQQAIVWDSTSMRWRNEFIKLESLANVTISNPASNHFLKWDGSGWVSSVVKPEDIFSYSKLALKKDQVLAWDYANKIWVPKTLSLENIIDSTINPATIENKSNIAWNSDTQKWELRKIDLNEVVNIEATSLVNENVLSWDTTTGKWIPRTIDSLVNAGASKLMNLTDIDITNLVDNALLMWDSTSNTWQTLAPTLENILGINEGAMDDGRVLTWNKSEARWEGRSIASTVVSVISNTDVEELANINVSSVTNKDALVWNSVTSQWENTKLTIDSFEGLSSTPAGGEDEYLSWSYLESKWKVKKLGLTEVLNTTQAYLVDKQVVAWNATESKWEPTDPSVLGSEIAGGIDLENLQNVNIVSPQNNQSLVWDSTISKWVNKHIETTGSSDPNDLEGLDWVQIFQNTLNY